MRYLSARFYYVFSLAQITIVEELLSEAVLRGDIVYR
jgi:hypothetical protein